MKDSIRLWSSATLLATLVTLPAAAATVSITIPRLKVAEYHRPYVALWLQPAAGGTPRTVAVWYDVHNTKGAEPGTKWLADLRSWWRKGGRSLKMPADGISGATRAPGVHKIGLPSDIAAGDYVLNIEAARETGGRETLSIPVTLPGGKASSSGKSELGAVTIQP